MGVVVGVAMLVKRVVINECGLSLKFFLKVEAYADNRNTTVRV